MLNLLVLASSTLYLTYIMVEADITATLRQRLAERSAFSLALLSCEKCSAFWAGVACSVLLAINPILLYPLAGGGAVLFLWPVWKKVSNYADS